MIAGPEREVLKREDFLRGLADGKAQLCASTIIADLDTPVSAYIKLAGGQRDAFLLESVEGGENLGRYSVIGLKPDLVWRCVDGRAETNRNPATAPDDFTTEAAAPLESLRALLAESRIDSDDEAGLPPMAPGGLFGYLGYDMVRQMENLPDNNPDTLGVPEAILIRPTLIAVFDNIARTITLSVPVRPDPQTAPEDAWETAQARLEAAAADLAQPAMRAPMSAPGGGTASPAGEPVSNTAHADYLAMVEKAKEYILAGDIFQVVPSQRFTMPFTLPALELYRALRRLNPSPFLFLLEFGDFSIVGSSPEILVRLRDGKVTIRPIAGTRPRGRDRTEDIALAEDLLADPKERAEHLMLLDLGRNDVGRVAKTGTVTVTDSYVIERYSHVMHIVSNVEAVPREGVDAVDALVAGFPAGTVSGAPKVRAMEIIDELEVARRGIYAGCIGYFAANGTMDTCIALRTAVIKDGQLHVQAGGGVVADSDPEAEYQETCNKARAIIRAAEEAVRVAQQRHPAAHQDAAPNPGQAADRIA